MTKIKYNKKTDEHKKSPKWYEKDAISGVHVHVSLSSAETLVRRSGIRIYRLIAYSLSNMSAKNYQCRLMCVEVIMCNISVAFLRRIVERVKLKRVNDYPMCEFDVCIMKQVFYITHNRGLSQTKRYILQLTVKCLHLFYGYYVFRSIWNAVS